MKQLLFSLVLLTSFSLSAQTNNYSLDFDGVNDYVSIPSSTDFDALNTSLTITAWINPDAASSGVSARIMERSLGIGDGPDRWTFTWSPTEDNLVMCFGVTENSYEGVCGSTPISLNQWTHVSATFFQGEVYIYINGQADGANQIPFTDISHVQGFDLNIAASLFGSGSLFPGMINEVTLWDIALDSESIQHYMNCPPNGNEAGLIGYWNFEEGTGTSTADLTTNGNDGTLNGAVTWSNNVHPYNCIGCPGDINGDNTINIEDFLFFNSVFGTDCNE